VLERVLERIGSDRDPSLNYFAELAALHEEMHCEAFTYTRQTLAYPAPGARFTSRCTAAVDCTGEVSLPARSFLLGATRDVPFVFDNEKWAHLVHVEPFVISSTCITNAQYSAFVDDRGYGRRELWCDEGWAWRIAAAAEHPVYWRKEGRSWYARRYDEWSALQADEPVIHVNWYEANAYCRWAGRRLPTEVEWECTASSVPGDNTTKRHYPWGAENPDATRANLYGAVDHVVPVSAYAAGDSAWGVRQLVGNVWEWTADAFKPYPGFVADPYKEYSEPWFGNHKVLRGGSFATRGHLIRNTWRNFYTPDRRDVFAGFRTCA
jgi:gamma-glutamyl hercynylcysteine S-oxide synthase